MEFTIKDKEYLLQVYGGVEKTLSEDLMQLMDAADVTEYELVEYERDGYNGKHKKTKISRASAIRILGRQMWLNGLVRSAFHWTACREAGPRRQVWFDSRELFI